MNESLRNPDSSVLNLVDSALKRTSIQRVYDIAFNTAAGLLESVGADALPVIESVLLDYSNARTAPDSLPGLSDVLVVYFDLAKQYGIDRACNLLKSLQGVFTTEALISIWSIWIGRRSSDQIPDQLVEAIELAAKQGDVESREKANALLQAYFKHRPK